ANTDVDGAYGARVASVDARLAVENLAAHDARFDVEEDFLHDVRIDVFEFARDLLQRVAADFVQARVAGLFLLDREGFAHLTLDQLGDARDERFVRRCRLPIPRLLARFVGQFVDGVDRGLHLLVTIDHAAQHHVFGQFLGFGLDHQHGVFGARDNQIHVAQLELRGGGVEYVVAVDVAHARRADRAVEGNAGNRQRGGNTQHRDDIGIDFGIDRHHGRHDLDLVIKALGEQRTDGAVDQTRG